MSFNSRLSAFLAGLALASTTPATAGNNVVPAPKKAAITATVNPHAIQEQSLITAYKPFLPELEGERYNMYDDHGKPAIGWGYNFDIKDTTEHSLIEVSPKVKGGAVSLNPKDMKTLASDELTLAEKRAKFPQYTLTQVKKTAEELKKIAKPAGMDDAFEGSVYVMSAAKVDALNNTRLKEFVKEASSLVGTSKFFNWTLGRQMAYLDMYYPLRKGIKDTRFHKYMMSGEFDKAATEAWTSNKEKSEPNKKKRRHETRSVWLKNGNILPAKVSAVYATYVSDLPGETRLHKAMKSFLDAEAKRNQEKGLKNAITKQNSPNGR